MKKHVNKRRKYYVLLHKSSKRIEIFTTKQGIAHRLNVHFTTIYRRLLSSSIYEDDECIIWQDVVIQYATRGK